MKPDAPIVSVADPVPDGLLSGDTPLDAEQLRMALRSFRDTIIASGTEAWRPERSVLMESMIETLVAQLLDNPDLCFAKVPN